MRRGRAALAAAAALACARPQPVAAPGDCPALVRDGQLRMGTVLELSLCAADRARGEALLARSFAQVAELERIVSTFDAESEASRLNRSAGSGPQRVSAPLVRLVADSIALARLTRGSFDVTVGPLVALWSAAGRADRLPAPGDLAAARARVGPDLVRADLVAGTVELRAAGAALDFGGIAKGWALDRVGESLRAQGVTRALLSFGESSLAALGEAPDGGGWGLALRDPAGGVAGTIDLRDRALSVSGSLGQSVAISGHRYGHVIDPRSGAPLERAQLAAVLARDGATAEALSKALLILGPREGIGLLEGLPDADGILIDENGQSWASRGWSAAAHWAARE